MNEVAKILRGQTMLVEAKNFFRPLPDAIARLLGGGGAGEDFSLQELEWAVRNSWQPILLCFPLYQTIWCFSRNSRKSSA
jgi:hypothetical protein